MIEDVMHANIRFSKAFCGTPNQPRERYYLETI
jgi:hypothetical protein